MSVDSMPAVPTNEAFGVFLGSSPPSINALAGYCVLWEGAGLRLPPPRRVIQGHIVSRHVQSPATISVTSRQHSDQDSYVSAATYPNGADDDLNQGDCDRLFIKRSSPIPCNERPRQANKAKKRVTFADNLGFDLEAVKVIRDEPCTPPPALCVPAPALCVPAASAFSTSSVDTSADGSAVPSTVETLRQACFRVDFPQPVSNYATFKARLLACCVAVENVTVESTAAAAARVSVTVKVKNLTFEKRVFLRATRNNWKSHKDFDASFLGSNPGSSDGPPSTECATYDTFLLRVDLAATLDASSFLSPIEFAVCYQASGSQEFWDNNGGSNYRLVAACSGVVPDAASGCSGGLLQQRLQQQKAAAAETAEQASDRWTAYAAWRTTGGGGGGDVPYW